MGGAGMIPAGRPPASPAGPPDATPDATPQPPSELGRETDRWVQQ